MILNSPQRIYLTAFSHLSSLSVIISSHFISSFGLSRLILTIRLKAEFAFAFAGCRLQATCNRCKFRLQLKLQTRAAGRKRESRLSFHLVAAFSIGCFFFVVIQISLLAKLEANLEL